MSDHSSKRQRLTGSFSPASPPYHLAAAKATSDQTKTPIIQPNTPTSPPYSSMNPQPNGGSAMPVTAPSSTMTPPSWVTMSQQASQSGPSDSNQYPFPTPASTAGLASSTNIDSDGDAMMEEGQDDDPTRLRERRHSNHNRQNRAIFSVTGGVKAADGICGSQLFKLCQSSHEVSRPHGSQNLFELYGLNDLAKSVARNDPETGEKINKLRKSYEGHIKSLQIAGKPKAVKMEGSLTIPLAFPDMEYDLQKVHGKEINKALTPDQKALDPKFDALLDSAFAGMAPGPLPPAESAKYRAYLGTDDASKAKGAAEGALHRTAPPTSAPTPNNSATAARPSRPERVGAKRAYTEVSFQGYGEGFGEDYGADSTGEDSHPKRRKIFEGPSRSVEVGGVRR